MCSSFIEHFLYQTNSIQLTLLLLHSCCQFVTTSGSLTRITNSATVAVFYSSMFYVSFCPVSMRVFICFYRPLVATNVVFLSYLGLLLLSHLRPWKCPWIHGCVAKWLSFYLFYQKGASYYKPMLVSFFFTNAARGSQACHIFMYVTNFIDSKYMVTNLIELICFVHLLCNP